MPTFDAYHIYRAPGATTWTARRHRMVYGEALPAYEAVELVKIGVSSYVEAGGLQSAIDQLALLDVVVEVQALDKGKEK